MRILLRAALLCSLSAPALGADYYVATSGSDGAAGTQGSPFRTITHADAVASPGDTIHVGAGSYTGPFTTSKSGTSGARIRFVSDVPWAAKIVSGGWWTAGNYVDVVDFEVDGSAFPTSENTGIYVTGSFSTAQGNYIHDIQLHETCTGKGAGGVVADSFYGGSNAQVFGNLVHDIGPPACGYDHGIYLSQPYSSAFNNVVYNISGVAIHCWHDATHVSVVNNTLVNSGDGVLIGGGDYYLTSGPSDYNVIANNIVASNTVGFNESGQLGTHNTYTHNLVYGNGVESSAWITGSLTNTIRSAPGFVGGGDYHLAAGSAAINAASAAYAPATDYDGNARSTPDIGAYEYSSTPTTQLPLVDLNGASIGTGGSANFAPLTPVEIAPAATITDGDSTDLVSLIATLGSRPDGNDVESLSLNAAATTAATGLTVAYNSASGTLSITGSASVATYQTILRGITYGNTDPSPTTTTRSVTVIVNDGSNNSTPRSVAITISYTPPPPTPEPGPEAGSQPTALLLIVPDHINWSKGEHAVIEWSSQNTAQCTGSGVSGTSGAIVARPRRTRIYSIICTGTAGSVSASAKLTVQ